MESYADYYVTQPIEGSCAALPACPRTNATGCRCAARGGGAARCSAPDDPPPPCHPPSTQDHRGPQDRLLRDGPRVSRLERPKVREAAPPMPQPALCVARACEPPPAPPAPLLCLHVPHPLHAASTLVAEGDRGGARKAQATWGMAGGATHRPRPTPHPRPQSPRVPHHRAAALARRYNCGNMGITAGCSDIYSSALDCQWIDVTDLPRPYWSQDLCLCVTVGGGAPVACCWARMGH